MEEQQPTIKKEDAATYYIRDPKHSYGIFCINTSGSLFLSSDWGTYGFTWNSFGKDFKDFIAHADAEYIVQKFDNATRFLHRQGIPKAFIPHLVHLLKLFQAELKKDALYDVILNDEIISRMHARLRTGCSDIEIIKELEIDSKTIAAVKHRYPLV